ncbi:MAG: dTDP-4-dehydrorhamnose 3,5-epimerase [Gemmatimonadaceae bacterium]
MQLLTTPLAGLWEIQTTPHGDDRGRLTRIFCTSAFSDIRPQLNFVQVNHSATARRGTIRGLHFQQAPAAEAKLIRCIRGSVFDVAVDLRPESATFGKWHAIELSEHNERQVFIPEGFAHGFQSLTDDAQMLYQHTAAYSKQHESGICYNDPTLLINWPLPVTVLSKRDANLPPLGAALLGTAA